MDTAASLRDQAYLCQLSNKGWSFAPQAVLILLTKFMTTDFLLLPFFMGQMRVTVAKIDLW